MKNGFLLLELMVAVALFSLTAYALMSMVGTAKRTAGRAGVRALMLVNLVNELEGKHVLPPQDDEVNRVPWQCVREERVQEIFLAGDARAACASIFPASILEQPLSMTVQRVKTFYSSGSCSVVPPLLIEGCLW